jgi:predicted PurR-regulated permease PerM
MIPHRSSAPKAVPGQWAFYRLATAVLTVAALFWAKSVLIPVALAVLLSFALTPLAEWLERRGLGRTPGALLVWALGRALVGGLGGVAVSQLRTLPEEISEHTPDLKAKFAPALHLAARLDPSGMLGKTEEPAPAVPAELTPGVPRPAQPPIPVTVVRPTGVDALEWLPSVAGPVAESFAATLLVTVLTIFLLVQRESVRDRMLALAGRRGLTATTRALEDARRRVSKFMLHQASTNATMGAITALGLWALGVPHPALWGVLTAALRFIPYIGIWVSALFPFALAVAIFPGWGHAFGVLALYGLSDAVMSNAVEPLLFGHGTGVSSLALLVAAAFWAFLWGPVGLLLAVPLTVCLVVLGEHSQSLKFFQVLLGDEPQVDPAARYFHRVLSRDADEAAVLVNEQAAQRQLLDVYDEMLVPTLAQAKGERDRGDLSPAEEREFYRVTREVLDGVLFTVRADTGATDEPARPAVRVIGCATKGEADRLVLGMLRDVARTTGCEIEVVAPAQLTTTAVKRAQRDKDLVVCIATVAPGGLAQAAGLIKQVKARVKGATVLVARCGASADRADAEQFLKAAGATKVTWNLRETLNAFAPGGAPAKAPKGVPEKPAEPNAVTVPA